MLLLPAQLLFSAVLAAALHELCHLAALLLCGCRIHAIEIDGGRAVIETAPLPPCQELLCAAAGPAGSFLCLALIRRFPFFALCGLVQGLYNLLPIHPLDGGRILLCVLTLTIPARAQEISRAVTILFCAAAMGCCFLLYLRTLRVLFLLLACYFLHSTGLCRKTPCKERRYWVQ